MCVPISLGVPTISQRLFARNEHVRASDLLVPELVNVQEAFPPVWTSAPYVTLRFVIVQAGSSLPQGASAEMFIGVDKVSLARAKRRNTKMVLMLPWLLILSL
jgi:hypothetical protein